MSDKAHRFSNLPIVPPKGTVFGKYCEPENGGDLRHVCSQLEQAGGITYPPAIGDGLEADADAVATAPDRSREIEREIEQLGETPAESEHLREQAKHRWDRRENEAHEGRRS